MKVVHGIIGDQLCLSEREDKPIQSRILSILQIFFCGSGRPQIPKIEFSRNPRLFPGFSGHFLRLSVDFWLYLCLEGVEFAQYSHYGISLDRYRTFSSITFCDICTI